MKKQTKNIGLNVKLPNKTCTDKKCPFHGNLKVRGRTFVGNVIKIGSSKTATIGLERPFFIKKYERYEKRRSKIKVYITPCIDVKKGDIVKIIECRPLSKTKNFVIIEVLKK